MPTLPTWPGWRGAAARWTGLAGAKGEVGLDEKEIRSWHGWDRHTTLALVSHAVLAAMRAIGKDREAVRQNGVPAARPDSLVAFRLGQSLP